MHRKPKVSVVIPAYNEEKLIGKTLESLYRQETKQKFEVIVVDNNSSDKTLSEVMKYKNKLNLIVFSEPMKGRGIARCCGFDNANGDIILSIDADTIAPYNWIENYVKHFKDRKVIAVTGPWKVSDLGFLTNFIINNFQIIANIPCFLAIGHFWINGLNFGIRRKIYIKSGGFDPTLNAHEDIDLTKRISKFGKIKYANNTCVLTSGRRYKDGVVLGLWDYEKTYISYFLLHNKRKELQDRR